MKFPLPPPLTGVPLDLRTAAGRVAEYRLALERVTIKHAGGLPQPAHADEAAAGIERFLG